MLQLNFHHWDSFISKMIRIVSGGFYNHVSIQIDGVIYEAHINCGVRRVELSEWDNSTVYSSRSFYVPPKRQKQVIIWLDKQVWKKYDLLGVLSFVWIFIKQKKGKFYCSELAMIALMKSFGIFSEEYSPRKTPQDVYEISNIIEHFLT